MKNRWYPAENCGVAIDGNGNLVSDATTTYTWDARDRLVSGGYGYDTGNLRVKMGAQTVLLDGIEEAREYGTNEARYDHDPSRVDGLLAQKTGAGKGYFVTDALGSVYAVVDASGATVSKYGYDVYGARTASAEGMATGWGFTGRRHDSGTEMYYRARYREMGSGGWMAADPAGFVDGLNRYRYARSRPTMGRDPLGLYYTNCSPERQQLLQRIVLAQFNHIRELRTKGFYYRKTTVDEVLAGGPSASGQAMRYSFEEMGPSPTLAFFLPWAIECKCSNPELDKLGVKGATAQVIDRTLYVYDAFFELPQLKGNQLHQEGVMAHEGTHLYEELVRGFVLHPSVWVYLRDSAGGGHLTRTAENLGEAVGEMARYSADPSAHAATSTGGYFEGEDLSSGLIEGF